MREIKLDIPKYTIESGITYNWTLGYEVRIVVTDDVVVIKSNKEGLQSFANHLLNLAQDDIPVGFHLHFDEHNSLEEGSSELIVEKVS